MSWNGASTELLGKDWHSNLGVKCKRRKRKKKTTQLQEDTLHTITRKDSDNASAVRNEELKEIIRKVCDVFLIQAVKDVKYQKMKTHFRFGDGEA